MNSNIRVFGVVFLIAIYCFAIGLSTKSLAYSDFNNEPPSSQEAYFSDFPAKLFSHTPQAENTVNSFNNIPVPGLKNLFNEQRAIASATDQLFDSAFIQYNHITGNILINHRKSNRIFPFHYYW